MENRVFKNWEDNSSSLEECIHTSNAFISGSIFVINDNKSLFVDCKELKNKLDEEFFFIMSGFCKTLCIHNSELENNIRLTQLLTDVELVSSNGEATQKIKEGTIKINTKQIKDIKKIIVKEDLFNGKWLLLQKGKGDLSIVMFWE